MGSSNGWLKARKRRLKIIAWIKKILSGSIIAALIVGPLIYFGVAAQETAQIIEGSLRDAAIKEAEATPEVKTSQTPIEFPKQKIKKPIKKDGLSFGIKQDRIPEKLQTPETTQETVAFDILDENKTKFAGEFGKSEEEFRIKQLDINYSDGSKEKSVILNNVTIDYGPAEIKLEPDANAAARIALQKYLNTLENSEKYAVLKDTTKLDQVTVTDALVLYQIRNHNTKWYADFQQYHNKLPVFDGNAKLIFTEKKKLLVLTDNIRRDLPAPEEFKVGTAVARESTQELFEWDESLDEIQFINKGYYKDKPAYKVEADAHNPIGKWDVYVNGIDGNVESLVSDIRLQDEPEAPAVEPVEVPTETPAAITEPPDSSEPPDGQQPPDETESSDEPVAEPQPSDDQQPSDSPQPPDETESSDEPATEPEPPDSSQPPDGLTPDQPATTEPEILPPEEPATQEPELEPEIEILQTLLSQVLGKIYPKTPADETTTEPFSNEYIYIDQTRLLTDSEGYFDNPAQKWYSLFLEGPYVAVHDDDNIANDDIINQTPENPFIWDENSASLAAINAFYHTNKIREWFSQNMEYQMNVPIPVTVNSQLVDAYLNGCGAWFNNSLKTIEYGRGGYEGEKDGISSPCPNDLNYALSSDLIYHEYTHYIVEDVTHLPNIQGAESAAMGEGLADYFAATINNDPLWGDVVSTRTRNLQNNLKYKYLTEEFVEDENGIMIPKEGTDMSGNAHHDGQIFGGALWDLRTAIGAEATDRLIFNTLYQGRLHFETFMYGMIIEDDDDADFSNGTPHLIAIIQAFENHGIGPGVENFNGLPILPEEWNKLLKEAGYEGEEEPILAGLSGDCNTTSLPGYLWVETGNTCTVAGDAGQTTFSYTGVVVQGILQVGAASTYNTTLVATGDSIQVYGTGAELRIGYNAATGVDARVQTTNSNDLRIYSGGFVFTRSNTNTGVDNYITIAGNTQVGGSTGSAGTLNLVDNNTLSTTYNLTVYDAFNVSNASAKLDVGNYTYIHQTTAGSVATITGSFETTYLAFGESDGAPDGGTLTNNGTVNVVYNAYLYDNALLTNNSGFTVGRTLQANDTASINNSGTITQSGAAYSLQLYDDCTLTNTNTISIAGDLSMDQIDTSAEADQPILYNDNGAITIGDMLYMYDYAEIRNETATGSPSTQYLTVENDLNMNNYSSIYNYGRFNVTDVAVLNNYSIFYNARNTSGTSVSGHFYVSNDITLNTASKLYNDVTGSTTNGIVDVIDDININSSAQIENYYWVRQGYSGTDGSTPPAMTLYSQAQFLNNDSSAYYYNYNSGTSDYGLLNIYDDAIFENYNYARVRRMHLGDTAPMSLEGGIFNNQSGGDLYVDETSVTEAAVFMRGGLIDNKSGSQTFDIDGIVTMTGYRDTSCLLTAEINNDSSITSTIRSVSMSDCTLIDNNAGNLTIDGEGNDTYGIISTSAGAQIYNDATMTARGTISMNSGSIYNGQNATATMNIGTSSSLGDLNMKGTAYFQNFSADDTVTVYDDVNMTDEFNTTARIDNYGDFNVTGSSDNLVDVAWEARINNVGSGAVFDVDSSSASYTDGLMKISDYNASYPKFYNNGGTVNAYRIELGSGSSNSSDTEFLNNSNGTVNTYYNSSEALVIYQASFTNENTATFTANNNGWIKVYGSSGIDKSGHLIHNSTGTNSANVQIFSYGIMNIMQGTHGGGTCRAFEDVGGANGRYIVDSGATLNCINIDMGSTVIAPGYIDNSGTVSSTTIDVYEDSVQTTTFEITNQEDARITATTINLGDSTHDGGEIQNLSGDWVQGGTDGIYATTINLYEDANIWNGCDRAGTGINGLSEINWVATPASETINILKGGAKVYNRGYIGGDKIELTGSMVYDNAYFYNDEAAFVDINTIKVNGYGEFETHSTSGGTDPVTVNDTLNVYANGEYKNYGNTQTLYLRVGDISNTLAGGTFTNNTDGEITITSTATNAAEVYDGGEVNILSGSDGFTSSGRLTIQGGTNPATFDIDGGALHGAATTYLPELWIKGSGTMTTNDYVEILATGSYTGQLILTGTSGNIGKLVIQGDTNNGNTSFYVDGETWIGDYGQIQNDSIVTGDGAGFIANDLVSVWSLGTITSDSTSEFQFNNGIYSAGTVTLGDDVASQDNTTSGYSIHVINGTFTMGSATNTGETAGVESESAGIVYVASGGVLNSYNHAIFNDTTVTGSGSEINFEDSKSPIYCQTFINGDLFVLSNGEATVNCTRTSGLVPRAVKVQPTSPGGHVQVEGTLNINTNLEADTMTIGDGASASGTVSHDYVGTGYITDPASTVFNLYVLDTLTINNNGSINVDAKSSYYDTLMAADHGGSHGGKGQCPTATPSAPYGQMDATENEFGYRGRGRGQQRGGGKATIIVGETVGDASQLIINGSISANGGDAEEGAGSGGSINIVAYGKMSGTASIKVNGGDQTNAAYSDTAGGGGRIFIASFDKSGYTGTVAAVGGVEADDTYFAGTGTIFYWNMDIWYNLPKGTLVIDGFGNSAIDVNRDNSTTKEDYTYSTEDLDIDSLQIDGGAGMYWWYSGSGGNLTLEYQQCIADNSGKFVGDTNAFIYYNPDHSQVQTTKCISTPDPPHTLYINNSATGAQSNYPSTKASPAHVQDITPATSAIHNDAELDKVPNNEDTDKAIKYQLQIATTPALLYANGADVCNIDDQSITTINDDARSVDILIPYASCNLEANTNYYWRIKFKDDELSDNGWGLWSYTNWFEVDEYGIIELDECNDGNPGLQLGGYDTELGDNYYTAWCSFVSEASAKAYIKVNKTDYLSQTTTGEEIWDMEHTDYDYAPMDGKDLSGDEVNEVGFYLTGVNTGTFTVYYAEALILFTSAFTYLPTLPTTILESNSSYYNETFTFNLGTFIHGLINSDTPRTSAPVNYCKKDQLAPCITKPGDYDTVLNVTVSTSP